MSESSIHAVLGEQGPLDLAMIRRAVEYGVREDERLDWKQTLYAKENGKEEFAKDVASFANSRGGLLVIGVAEDRATGCASAVRPVAATDATERQMRAWLHTAVNPPVPGIQFQRLLDEGGEGVLVIQVPESPDMPHMVGSDRSCGFPVRVGTQTQWMREFDLERAYRQRFDRRASDEETLSGLIDRAVDHLDLDEGCWVVAAARPTVPSSTSLDRSDVRRLLETADEGHNELKPEQARLANIIDALGQAAHNPRIGFRKWVMSSRAEPRPSLRSDSAYVELHNDGSIVVAGLAGGYHEQEQVKDRNTVPEFALTGVVSGLVNLIAATAAERGSFGSVLVRIDLARADDVPYAFLQPERSFSGQIRSAPAQPGWSLDVRRFVPVDEVVLPDTDLDRKREVASRLVSGVSTQFGVSPEDFGYAWPRND